MDTFDEILGVLGTVICHKDYARYLRSKGLRLALIDILDWNGGVGKWRVYRQ